jgi:two-component system, probable response regulator PhcQ
MKPAGDYEKYALLYVDDEDQCLTLFKRAFADSYRIFTANQAQAGYHLLQNHPHEIALIISDQRMPGEDGVQFLEKTRALAPQAIRILLTAYANYESAVEAINAGAIYKYITKPWKIPQLKLVLKQGMDLFLARQARDQLLREKLTDLHKTLVADRVISMGELAAGMGHHVRNALQSVLTFLELLPDMLQEENVRLDQVRNPDYWRDFYEQVQGQVKHITEMFNNFGLISRGLPWQFRDAVALRDLIVQAEKSMRNQLQAKQIRVVNEVPADLPWLQVERSKFAQLLTFLIADEIIHLPAQSQIVFRSRVLTGADAGVQLVVEDDGPGLSTEVMESIFNPFATRTDQPHEFGLNLMACYFIVYQHGGRLQISNRQPQGVTFTLTLPQNPEHERSVPSGLSLLNRVIAPQ